MLKGWKGKNTNGSIVVEASIILPLFLSFLILLIAFIQIAMVEIALENAVSEAVKQVSAHFYPVDIAYNAFNHTKLGQQVSKLTESAKGARYKIIEAENLLKEYDYIFSDGIKAILKIRPALENGANSIYDEAVGKAFYPVLIHYTDQRIIDRENLYVTKVTLPNLKEREQAYFGMEVRYDLPLKIPFFHRVIALKKQAYERVWLGNSVAFVKDIDKEESDTDQRPPSDDQETTEEDSEENKEEYLLIDSINSPVQRGRTVRIIAIGPANKLANITIYYKSGFVKDKGCRFDSDGWALCELKIGGHANEGIYQAVVESGELTAKKSFGVMSKDNYMRYYR